MMYLNLTLNPKKEIKTKQNVTSGSDSSHKLTLVNKPMNTKDRCTAVSTYFETFHQYISITSHGMKFEDFKTFSKHVTSRLKLTAPYSQRQFDITKHDRNPMFPVSYYLIPNRFEAHNMGTRSNFQGKLKVNDYY